MINRLDLHYRGQALTTVTASFRVACFPKHGTTATTLIHAADAALYQAKAAGHNRVLTIELNQIDGSQ